MGLESIASATHGLFAQFRVKNAAPPEERAFGKSLEPEASGEKAFVLGLFSRESCSS
jgi:hypothetical protein